MLSSYRSPRSWISLLTPLLGAQVALGSIDLNLDDESKEASAPHLPRFMQNVVLAANRTFAVGE